MLRVTVDVFSGRANPAYTLSDTEARDLLRDVSRRQAAITDTSTGFDGLGFRGVIVESLGDDTNDEIGSDLPEQFRVGGGGALDEANGLELAERLVRGLSDHELTADSVPLDDGLMQYVLELLQEPRGGGSQSVLDGASIPERAPEDALIPTGGSN